LVIEPLVFPHTTTVPSRLIATACDNDADTATSGLLVLSAGNPLVLHDSDAGSPHATKLPSALNANPADPPAATATDRTKFVEPRLVNWSGTFVTPTVELPHATTVPSDLTTTP
jgi:hypothetical protein